MFSGPYYSKGADVGLAVCAGPTPLSALEN